MRQEVDGEPVQYDRLQINFRPGMERYIEERIRPGGFLAAVLRNDLMDAAVRADETVDLRALVKWLYNHAPPDCYGSPEKFEAWRAGVIKC